MPVLRKFYTETLTMAVDVGSTSLLLRNGVTAVISLCDKFSMLDGVYSGMLPGVQVWAVLEIFRCFEKFWTR